MDADRSDYQHLLALVQGALDAAKATTDEQVREHAKAPASDPRSIARFSYAQGLRDGVVMACEQILARAGTVTDDAR